TYDLADESDYAECGNCLTIDRYDDNFNHEKTFLVQSGTLHVTELGYEGEGFKATIENAKFIEVEIGAGFISTPVQDGETYCIDHLELDYTFSDYGGGDNDLPTSFIPP